MRRSLVVATLTLTLAAPALAEPIEESCCACVAEAHWLTSLTGPPPPMLEPAFFCSLIIGPEEGKAFEARCDAVNGDMACPAPVAMTAQDNLDCNEILFEAGIACPATKPVPASGPPLLAALVAALAGLGVWAARRRRRSAR